MELCSGSRTNPHSEICYYDTSCPLCETMNRIQELEEQIQELEEEVAQKE